ncbi:uncharacterized protein BXIN_2279 [Babesia sp. Xinjiang]|uniref:uncharacterized protein n=1 Tax=Babesia sp. Xinjiang TaxID=462227 RepID=UPI000A21CC61|nr:uncharacterized protein BXIN_2279 [Babesia sp. Xinjiang]ORM40823.1 hypothetical protein BXIN_2279 [Babesia sp. Xinjiang]
MVGFDVPCCSVCYEYLNSKLCALTRCGHVYHRQCITQWTARTEKHKVGCPLCRCSIPAKGIIELQLEFGEISASERKNDGEGNPEVVSEQVLDLRHRLAQAVSDKLDMQERCAEIENENAAIQEALLHARDYNAVLDDENKDLKLIAEANKTSIAKLNETVTRQKRRLAKLEDVHNYLKAESNNEEGFNSYLKTLSTDEKLTLLTNRVAELEGINKTLTELRDVWKRKCEKISREYLILEREYKTALTRQPIAQQFEPDPLNDPLSNSTGHKDAEPDNDVLKKTRRAIDFGVMGNGRNTIWGNKNLPPKPEPFVFAPPTDLLHSTKPKKQKISDFFKPQ